MTELSCELKALGEVNRLVGRLNVEFVFAGAGNDESGCDDGLGVGDASVFFRRLGLSNGLRLLFPAGGVVAGARGRAENGF